jgi:hypothetical protein
MNEPGNHAISLGVIVILGVELPAAADRALAMLARRPLSGALGDTNEADMELIHARAACHRVIL